ncbi:aminotransferase class IV [Stappia sp.]|uniref:aminotransferase class IV n=1 Tax=Stappia sp. TaxID=1870903 RepID=UPI003A98F3F3
MKTGLAYQDGRFIEHGSANLLWTHALHYATSVFEGIRVYGGAPFLLSEHIQRLYRSCELVGLDFHMPIDECIGLCREIILRSNLEEAYLRPVVYNAGPDLGVHAPANDTRLGLLIWEWPSVFGGDASRRGLALSSDVPWRRPAPQSFPVQAKASAGYLLGSINRRIAEKAGFDDALVLTHDGMVAEATGANIFIVRNGRVATPPATSFLDGLTRRTVIGLLDGVAPLDVIPLTLADLHQADEIFLTGTAYEVMPVGRLDSRTLPCGPLTTDLRDRYLHLTRSTSIVQESIA